MKWVSVWARLHVCGRICVPSEWINNSTDSARINCATSTAVCSMHVIALLHGARWNILRCGIACKLLVHFMGKNYCILHKLKISLVDFSAIFVAASPRPRTHPIYCHSMHFLSYCLCTSGEHLHLHDCLHQPRQHKFNYCEHCVCWKHKAVDGTRRIKFFAHTHTHRAVEHTKETR